MRGITIALLSIAALAFTADLAQARDGCGSGRYFNGYRCAWMGGRTMVPRVYERTYGTVGSGSGYYRPNPRFGGSGCQRGYTVQDGLCKPYRGF